MVVLKWLWVVNLRRYARGKCIQRIADGSMIYCNGGVKVALGGRFVTLS